MAKVIAIVLSYPLVLAQARIHAMDKSKHAKDGASVDASVYGVLRRTVAEEVRWPVLSVCAQKSHADSHPALQGFLGLYGGLWATVSGESLKNALKFMLKDQFAATAATIAGLVFA